MTRVTVQLIDTPEDGPWTVMDRHGDFWSFPAGEGAPYVPLGAYAETDYIEPGAVIEVEVIDLTAEEATR